MLPKTNTQDANDLFAFRFQIFLIVVLSITYLDTYKLDLMNDDIIDSIKWNI